MKIYSTPTRSASEGLFFPRLRFGLVCLLFASLLLAPSPAPSQPPRRTDRELVDQVNTAITKGIKYLRSRQTRNGDWNNWEVGGEFATKPGGVTSLVLLALLNAGVSPRDPAIVDGLKYLRSEVKPQSTYVVGLQTMVFAAAGYPEDLPAIQRNATWLVDHRITAGGRAPNPVAMPPMQGWTYGVTPGEPDNSNTQYAILGLHAAREAGAKVPPEVWEWMREYYRDSQERPGRSGREGGAWRYKNNWGPSLSMTLAGLCNLLIAGMEAEKGKEVVTDIGARGCGVYEENENIERALRWIGRALPASPDDFREQPHLYYTLYGIERAGRLSGQRFLGGRDWYRLGCEFLVDAQLVDGSWQGGKYAEDNNPVLATSFSLLFLSKGRTPVLVSKLAHGPEGSTDWNNDRNDVRNLVDFASKELFQHQPMAWQIFDIKEPRRNNESIDSLAAVLLQTPVVYLNGHLNADLANPDGSLTSEGELLRQYVENGGFVFAEACCSDARFDARFKEQILKVVKGGKLEPVPPDHPLWTASNRFASSPDRFKLWGIQQGCRWAVIYSPQDLSCRWESNDRERYRAEFNLGANILAYATGLEPPGYKGTPAAITQGKIVGKPPHGSLKVAQLRPQTGFKKADEAIRNLMLELRARGFKNVVVPDPNDFDARNGIEPIAQGFLFYRFLYLHGRQEFTFSPEDRDKLRFNLQTGGLLLADACCGSPKFDESFRKLMKELWPQATLEPIPLDDELYSARLNGEQISQVRCRRRDADGKVLPGLQSVPPELEGIRLNGRWVVIYSKYDLGCALQHHKASDCVGHDYDSARKLAMAAVLYALNR